MGCNRNAGQEGRRTRGIQDRRDVEQEGFRTGGMYITGVIQDWRDVGQEGCRTGVMQEKRDARKGGIQEREVFRKGGIQERRDSGK